MAGAGVFALLLLLVALTPWWLPLALRPALKAGGTTFERYERLPEARFALHGLHHSSPGLEAAVERLEARQPLRWLRRVRAEADQTPEAPYLRIEGWSVLYDGTVERTPPSDPRPAPAPSEVLRQVGRILLGLDFWMPWAVANEGRFEMAGRSWEVPSASWKRGRVELAATGTDPDHRLRLDVDLAPLREGGEGRLELIEEIHQLALTGRLSVEDASIRAHGELAYGSNVAAWAAEWVDDDWVPSVGSLDGEDWALPAERIGLDEYYREVIGSFRMRTRGLTAAVDLRIEADPTEEAVLEVPPLVIEADATLEPDRIEVRSLQATMPGVELRLDRPVVFGWEPELPGEPARLDLVADLAALPWVKARGRVEGRVDVVPAEGHWPRFDFDLRGGGLGWADLAVGIETLTAAGRLEWPRLAIEQVRASIGEGSRVELAGAIDLETLVLETIEWSTELSPDVMEPWIPEGLRVGKISAGGALLGALAEPEHEGWLEVADLSQDPLETMTVVMEWEGDGIARLAAHLEASNAAGGVRLSATAGTGQGGGWAGSLETLHWRFDPDEPSLELAAPAVWKVYPNDGDGLEIELGRLELAQGGVERLVLGARLVGRKHGEVLLKAVQPQPEWLAWIYREALPEAALDRIFLEAAWDDGPLTGRLETAGSYHPPGADTGPLRVAVDIAAGPAGLHLDPLDIEALGRVILSANGILPVALYPGADDRLLRVLENLEVGLRVELSPHPAFWEAVGEWTGIHLTRPEGTIDLAGRPERLSGRIDLGIEEIRLPPRVEAVSWPRLSDLQLEAVLDQNRAELKQMTLRLAGQPVRAVGLLPLPAGFWPSLLERPELPDWREASLDLEVPETDLAELARFFPEYLAPRGLFDLSVRLRPGADWTGRLRIEDAATRPFLPFGSLQDINADIAFADGQLRFRDVSGRAGGELLSITGSIDPFSGDSPGMDLTLSGQNLPLVRQAGLVLRSDLEVSVRAPPGGNPRVTGRVGLRNGLFLMDLRALMPGGGRGAAQRPPYFSVDEAPFADWELDVVITGDRFMRVQTPLFRGELDAAFRLQGTLRDPIAIGEAGVVDGQVLFPFATFAVQQGNVVLTRENPFEPRIFVTGTSRRYGYDLRFEVSGTASDPQLVLTSTPSLSSETILLMVMAGELPTEEIGFTQQQRATRIGFFLGRGLFGGPGAGGGLADRLTIDSGERISRQGRETYRMEFEIDSRWLLVGEYDEFDAYNAGIKWRFISRGGTRSGGVR